MSKVTDRILWSILVLALGVSLFLIFSPAGKSLVNDVVDELCFTGASQVSDFDVSPRIVTKNDQIVEQDVVGDSQQLSRLYANYNVEKIDHRGLGFDITPKNDAAGVYRLVSTDDKSMYLSLRLKYDIHNLKSFDSPLTADFDGKWNSVIVEIYLEGADGISHDYESFTQCFYDSDLHKSRQGYAEGHWKLPASQRGLKVDLIRIYAANLNADSIELSDLNVGVWNGTIKYVKN